LGSSAPSSLRAMSSRLMTMRRALNRSASKTLSGYSLSPPARHATLPPWARTKVTAVPRTSPSRS
jgi:hypothetical protein